MSQFNLNLPLDIPWRRIAVTEDMIDDKVGDRKFPLRWQSSISVFDYQPEDDYQNYEGMIVSYLKVTCSITGFQPRGDEVGLNHSSARIGSDKLEDGDLLIDPARWKDTRVVNAYKKAIDDYYGCYGAILEVAVSPKGNRDGFKKSEYPFFIDFEPKKRELFEVVTETGETMSRSLSGLNVRKGSTTTESHEVLDIFGGVNVQASYAGTGGGVGVQGQWGTKDVNQTEYVDMRTTDAAREKRETFSHATQLSQMYHQLNSYHIGTNRALFYILPRPHIVQLSSDNPEEIDRSTFVDGPRLLEGIQEFFLVVLRPKEMEDLCVEAYLETAHIFQEKIPEYRRADNFVEEFVVEGSLNEKEGETERIENEDEAKGFLERVGDAAGAGTVGMLLGGPIGAALGALFGAAWNEAFGDTLDKTTMTAITRTFSPSGTDVKFDLSRRTQATCFPVGERKQYIGCQIFSEDMTEDQVRALGSVYSQKFTENTFFFDTGTKREIGKATIRVEVPQLAREPVYVNGEKALFLTGRGVSTCAPRKPRDPKWPPMDDPVIVWEGPHFDPVPATVEPGVVVADPGIVGTGVRMTRRAANAMGDKIKRALLESATSSDRRPRGVVRFAESDFFARYVSKIIETSPSDKTSLEKLDGLGGDLVAKIKKKACRRLNRTDVLKADIGLLAGRLGLDLKEVIDLRRAALGLVTKKEAEKIEPPDPCRYVEVPNLVGLSRAEADTALDRAGLTLGPITTVSDETPKGYVLAQHPDAKTEVPEGEFVAVELSSGRTRVPDVIGLDVGEAMVALRQAGFDCVPEVELTKSEDKGQERRVLDIHPPERAFAYPNTRVRLLVGDCRTDDGDDVDKDVDKLVE